VARAIIAVIVGYFVIALSIALIFSLAFVAPDFAFEKGTATTTMGWNIYTLLAGLGGAMLGGFVATRIVSRDGRPARFPLAFAAIVLVLGLVSAWTEAKRERPSITPTRESIESMSVYDRAQLSRQPTWYALTASALGAVGVLLGSGITSRKRE
jgi:MFS family permease